MNKCENCIHKKVCRIREFPSIEEILKDGCPHYKDVVKEIFEDIENLKHTQWDWGDVVEWEAIAELKNKYIGEVTDNG